VSDFIDTLQRELVDASRRAYPAPGPAPRPHGAPGPGRLLGRYSVRTILATCLLAGVTATAGAAGTVLTLRGTVIGAPAKEDVPPEQTPVPDTVRVSALRAEDPDPDVPPWTVRVAKGRTGYVCSTVGQVVGDRFGLVGLDGRFRPMAPEVTDSCSTPTGGRATLLGARVLSGDRRRAVRTVVNGVAPGVRSVTVIARGRARPALVDADGVFVAALRGYPEDLALRLTLRFSDGRVQTEVLGAGDPSVVVDPDGGPAWRVSASMLSGDARTCVSFSWARRSPAAPRSPGACGILRRKSPTSPRQTGLFFAVRRLPGPAASPRGMWQGDWAGRPARTAVWGQAGDDVRRVVVEGAPGGPHRVGRRPGGTFLALFPASVDPAELRVRVTRVTGATRTYTDDTNLTAPPTP
jgi:hypothetical protein